MLLQREVYEGKQCDGNKCEYGGIVKVKKDVQLQIVMVQGTTLRASGEGDIVGCGAEGE